MQPSHLIFVLVIALIVLGPKRLPEVGRSLGRGIRDFREAMSAGQAGHPEVTAAAADESIGQQHHHEPAEQTHEEPASGQPDTPDAPDTPHTDPPKPTG